MDQNPKSKTSGRASHPHPSRLAGLPFPLLLATMAVLWAVDGRGSYESPLLLVALDFVFATLASLFTAYLIGRSFVLRGTPGLLLQACGVLVWGLAGFVGSAVAGTDANIQITIHHTGVWLAALCHLIGAVLSVRPRPAVHAAGLWLAAGYVWILGIIGLVALAALAHWTPTFFVPGQGVTLLRQIVLGSALAMLSLTVVLWTVASRRLLSAFTHWYVMALALLAAGLFGVMLQPAHGSLLAWLGRATQFLGGAYLVVAALACVRESRAWGLPLEAALRESEERFRIMADGSPILIWVTDADGGIQFVNRTYREFFGLPCEQVQRETWQPPIHPEDATTYRAEFLRAVQECRPFKAEARVRRADGQWRWIASHAEPHFSATGEFLGHIGAGPDLTERKRAEEALRELNATLESKVAQRTAELEHRARQLQKLTLELSQAEDRERRRVAAILHEDLQQQIAGAKFHLGLLKNRADDDRQQVIVDKIDDMLKEAIEKSRCLSHDLSPAVVHMNDLAEVLQWLANQVRAKHGLTVHVKVAGEAAVQSEAMTMFLFRAAQELLFNTVKHAQVKEAEVRVRRRGRYVRLSVSDQGCGFDPQELKETAGFGLLSIRERVELLGGRMKIKSAAGQGSRFHIVVPDGLKREDRKQKTEDRGRMAENGTVLRRPSSVLPRPSSGCVLRVLLADDHEVVRQGLLSLLREVPGIEVVGEAANGRDAVALAGELRPDVTVVDVSMPLMGGEEAIRQIKERLPETRIIALSMHEETETIAKMYEAGAESYVLKTAPSENLLAAIRGGRSWG